MREREREREREGERERERESPRCDERERLGHLALLSPQGGLDGSAIASGWPRWLRCRLKNLQQAKILIEKKKENVVFFNFWKKKKNCFNVNLDLNFCIFICFY